MVSIPVHILPLALALAGASGLRAFLPAFYLTLALHLGLFNHEQLNWHFRDIIDLHSHVLLLGLGALTAIEIIVEKIPTVAASLELFMLALRMVGAVTLALAVLPLNDLSTAVTIAMVTGVIGAISILSLQVRLQASDVVHLPFLSASCLTDLVCLAVVSVALQKPYAALVILYACTWTVTLTTHIWTRKLQRNAAIKSLPAAPELPEDFRP